MKLEYLSRIDIPIAERTLPALLKRQVKLRGDRRMLTFEGAVYTYREADLLSNRFAHALASAGVTQRDHVGFMIDNRPEVLWLLFAIAKLNAVAVPINTAAKGQQLRYLLAFFDVSTFVGDGALIDRLIEVRDSVPKLRRIVLLDLPEARVIDAGVPIFDISTLLTNEAEAPAVPVRFCDLSHIAYTSGTTGPSKGCMATQSSLISSAIAYSQGFGYTDQDVIYTCLPLFHSNAYVSSCLGAIVTGACIALSRRFSMSSFWKEIRQTKATQVNVLGAMANIIWNHPCSQDDGNHALRLVFMVPIPAFAREFADRFNVRITGTYALTDYGTMTLLRPDHPPSKWQSAGQVRPEMTVAILDENDMKVVPGAVGEICVRAEEAFISTQGYYKMPDVTLASRRNLWFHTGDHGYVDEEGFLYFSDRMTDSIRRRGENISAHEVEQVLLMHPDIEDAAAYGVPSDLGEHEVMVSIVPKQGVTIDPAQIIEYCHTRMAYFMVPRYVELVASLPRTATQKVEKFKLRTSAVSRLPSIWDRERAGVLVKR
jgi:carnitine-CoA ligase